MKKHLLLALAGIALAISAEAAPPVLAEETQTQLRMPAVPLVVHDPFLSVWSPADTLNATWPAHWTGTANALCGLVRVDGKTYVFSGNPRQENIAPAKQKTVRVTATRTQYVFSAGGIDLTVTFTNPLLIDDIEVLSRPASYVHFSANATDGKAHMVQLYVDATAEWTVNETAQNVTWQTLPENGTDIISIGTTSQKTLERRGDHVRIDWGHLLLASAKNQKGTAYLGGVDDARVFFAGTGKVPASEPAQARAANDRWPGLAFQYDLGMVSASAAERLLVIAYNDDYSIQYFKQNLRPWWNRDGKKNGTDLVKLALAEHDKLAKRCTEMDKKIATDALKAGGQKYADLCIAAYRQAIAAHKVVAGPKGQLFFFSKENDSNGSIGTIDVTYPSFPLFASYNTTLARGLCDFIFDYVESGTWTKPFAPHDVGTYPQANGQTYGGDMPIEETANMLVMVSVIAKLEGKPDYIKQHYETLTTWANYLVKNGLDPANQLCTDDFAGHFARNANLSLKAIVALGAFAEELKKAGQNDAADYYHKIAVLYAQVWPELARDGDHYGLVFGTSGTWSLKYNIIWDKILKLGLFDPQITKQEYAFYLKKQNPYGIPLDNRKDYSKSDWILWTAILASNQAEFDALVDPVWKYVNETPTRVPISDWHWTTDGKKRGFMARSTVGGYWIKVLEEKIKN